MGIQKLETLKSNWFDTKRAISCTVLGKSIILRHTHTHTHYVYTYTYFAAPCRHLARQLVHDKDEVVEIGSSLGKCTEILVSRRGG